MQHMKKSMTECGKKVIGSAASIEGWSEQLRIHRKPEGMAACLLPYEADGTIAWDAFGAALERTTEAGLVCAINMDTGYANLISAAERQTILDFGAKRLAGVGFVAGVFVEGMDGDLVDLYRQQADEIVAQGGTPILFQTTRFHAWSSEEIVDLYRTVCRGYPAVLGFELGKVFAPNGMIYDEETVRGLMSIPELKGIKHSSLDRGLEMRRLAIRDEVRPDFRIYTGNDLGINMIEYGSDYLLGLAAFCPEKFAERDRLWAAGDAGYYALADALQYLGNVAFRKEVPAYKHSCAVFQHLLGRIPSDLTHPQSAKRPAWEAEMMADCARRLGCDFSGSL